MKKITLIIITLLIVSGWKSGLYAQNLTDSCTKTYEITLSIHPDAVKSIDSLEKYVNICEKKSSKIVTILKKYDSTRMMPTSGPDYDTWENLTIEYLIAREKSFLILTIRPEKIIQNEISIAKKQGDKNQVQKLINEIEKRHILQQRLTEANNNILALEKDT